MPKVFASAFLGLALALCLSVNAADRVEPVIVPDSVDLQVPPIQQKADNWCWLAAAEMVVYYRKWGLSPTQCEIMDIGRGEEKGTCCDDPSACDRPGSLDEIRRVIRHFGKAKSRYAGALPAMRLYDALKKDNVVIAALRRPDQPMGHVVVIKGMRFVVKWLPGRTADDGPRQLVVPYVSVNDPRGVYTESVPYPNLARYWHASIIVE